MGTLGDIVDGIKRVIEIEGDVKRLAGQVEKMSDNISDHEKRLIRIETMIEMAQSRSVRATASPPQIED